MKVIFCVPFLHNSTEKALARNNINLILILRFIVFLDFRQKIESGSLLPPSMFCPLSEIGRVCQLENLSFVGVHFHFDYDSSLFTFRGIFGETANKSH